MVKRKVRVINTKENAMPEAASEGCKNRVLHIDFGVGTVIDQRVEEETNIPIYCVMFDTKNPSILHEGLEKYTGDLPEKVREGRCWWCEKEELTFI